MRRPDWTHRGEYIRTRRARKGDSREVDIEPSWANEAFGDVAAVTIPDPRSRSGRGMRTVGWSESAAMLITIISIEDEGTLWGVNAWKANRWDRDLYRRWNDE